MHVHATLYRLAQKQKYGDGCKVRMSNREGKKRALERILLSLSSEEKLDRVLQVLEESAEEKEQSGEGSAERLSKCTYEYLTRCMEHISSCYLAWP